MTASPAAAATRAILPREYGAYAELAFPLLTAFLAAGVTAAGLAFAVAVMAGFLVREPLAVLNGVRGARLEASLGTPARRAAIVLGGLFLGGAGVGMLLARPEARWAALMPGAVAALLTPALLRGRPKTLGAEVLVAFALPGMILPIGLAGRLPLDRAAAAAGVWAASFVLATLSVHGIKARAKPALGNTWTIWATPVLAVLVSGTAVVAAFRETVSVPVALAVLPSVLGVLAAAVLRVHPRQLKQVGWSLVGANLITLVLLLVG